MTENPDNPGIFVRIFDEDDFEVKWLNGNEIIVLAKDEEGLGGETIVDYLERKLHADSYVRKMYSSKGVYEGETVLRNLTLYEAVHYLGRDARICAFLRPKMQAVRFAEGLQKGKNQTEYAVAEEVLTLLCHFDNKAELQLSKSGLYRQMEDQLLNIITRLN